MKLHTFLTTAAFTALAAFTASTALGATITWGAATDITADTDVSLNGTFVAAANFGDQGSAPTTTVNGVTFTSLQGFTPSNANFTLTGLISLATSILPAPPFSNLSASYRDLLRSAPRGLPLSLTLNGLTVGQTYEVEVWANFSVPGPGSTTITTAGAPLVLDDNRNDLNGGLGQYAVGTFMADAATQSISINGRLNAAQLRNVTAPVVPEPGTGLFALGLAGSAMVSRRRR